jgi:5'-3' exonuclease
MQLVDGGITMLDPIKERKIGRDEVVEKFGVQPEQVVDVQALAGDSTDNVPGVPGIGVKTAAQLITEYGDLETLLERAGEIKQPKRREKLIENAELARISKKLVRLDPEVPIETTIDDFALKQPVAEDLRAFLERYEFRSLLRRLSDQLGGAEETATAAEAPPDPPRRPPTSWCRICRRWSAGWRRRSCAASSRWTPRRPRSTPWRRSWSASRWRPPPARPATFPSATRAPARRKATSTSTARQRRRGRFR